ncbi:GNAT family N-acetyltransferase [Nakamurella sp. A5-74]|uniref:GNAT family N-acetyltransferase n=1 Tax=Nakamurella sp. A5-74 TaxID=3158264 RepID=A0AAU8DRL3_9ACTN
MIETDRLFLRRQIAADDAAVLHELWTERDPRVPPHRRIGPDGRPVLEDIAAQIDADSDDPGREFLTIVRKQEGDVIGYCGLLFVGRGSAHEPEIAYELLGRAHGAGYATEAAGALVAWAQERGFGRLWAGVREWNLASRRVLQKLGFVETGQVEPDAAYGDSLVVVRTFPGSTV